MNLIKIAQILTSSFNRNSIFVVRFQLDRFCHSIYLSDFDSDSPIWFVSPNHPSLTCTCSAWNSSIFSLTIQTMADLKTTFGTFILPSGRVLGIYSIQFIFIGKHEFYPSSGKLIFDCCKKSLNQLLNPSIHPIIHPGLDFFHCRT